MLFIFYSFSYVASHPPLQDRLHGLRFLGLALQCGFWGGKGGDVGALVTIHGVTSSHFLWGRGPGRCDPDFLTQACLSASLPHPWGLLAEEGQGEVRVSSLEEVAGARRSLCLVLAQNTGKLASENLPLHPAPCQSFPSIASHSHAPLIPHASRSSTVGTAK